MIASEYGYTMDQIASHSMREIDWMLHAIMTRKNRQNVFDASLHGAKISLPTGYEEPPEEVEALDEKTLGVVERMAESSLAAKRKERFGGK